MENFNELQREILRLKKEKNALILAHYYVPLEVQDVADAVCDSFAMAQKAAKARESVIVICGVRFMGESAKILSPEKTVLLPSPDAGCPMADMVTPEDVLRLKSQHPRAQVMCYVNSSAAVKAVSDVCCTSSSALRIAKNLDCEEIIFVPDRHLGSFVARHVPEKTFWLHPGFCPTHHRITEADVLAAKKAHPDAEFAVHPEIGRGRGQARRSGGLHRRDLEFRPQVRRGGDPHRHRERDRGAAPPGKTGQEDLRRGQLLRLPQHEKSHPGGPL